ncbi:nicotinate-nucleotide adenylyltransferase [Desulfoferrobacter suflitae]|uniref:nicotinate-nucleotide adenylyltransferase n=1 Tax=Desulfoferrobacter suflitae TaxID=2865782 RepID=UPI002164E6E3|nr:nicotinate-nucleotide adenylyltransferase [Desulfoferrobacter suflitae]MCK8602755.1 nicotinate-nucleotide adenylyltransferase [Desulfoferrobacter suflitae]
MSETGVIHGRFQVFHNDHLKYLMAGKARCTHLVVGITNPDPTLIGKDVSDPQRSSRLSNPLTYFERYTMVRAVLAEAGVRGEELSIVPLPINFPELYRFYVPLEATFYLTIYDGWGRRKLELFHSLGLKTEILWEKPPEAKGVTGGQVRKLIAEKGIWEHLVPPATACLIKKWNLEERLNKLAVES